MLVYPILKAGEGTTVAEGPAAKSCRGSVFIYALSSIILQFIYFLDLHVHPVCFT